MRLNRYLSRYAGVSRREADRMIEAGRVDVDGSIASLGMVIDPDGAAVTVDGETVVPDDTRHYHALYKPVGYICSTARQAEDDLLVTDLAPGGVRLFPVGRLDRDSEGLILLTDDGELSDSLLRSRYGHEKEYIVDLARTVPGDVIERIRAGGLDIGEKRFTKPCTVEKMRDDQVRIVLREGMNRQIRRVFGLFDIEVARLLRIRFADIELGDMRPGEIRTLTAKEVETLKEIAAHKEV